MICQQLVLMMLHNLVMRGRRCLKKKMLSRKLALRTPAAYLGVDVAVGKDTGRTKASLQSGGKV